MEKLRMESSNLSQQNISKIEEIFPNCVTESRGNDGRVHKEVNFRLLQQMLLQEVGEQEERYEFSWVGKNASIVEANRPIRKTLRPCKEDSVAWDTTENLYIEGDNLEVLKLLQESYLNSVKMIYIDPPYNTGNDFVYRDDFAIGRDEYDADSGAVDDAGNRLFRNTDSNGRFHSDWCSMIYSRLLLSRNLLAEDGVIFISIDDYEIQNLRKICDEIFGENNFVAQLTTVMNMKGNNDEFGFAGTHEYILVYMKNKKSVSDLNGMSLTDEDKQDYKLKDERGYYKKGATLMRTGEAGAREKRPKGFYPIYVSNDLKSLNIERQSASDIEVYPRTVSGVDMSWRRSPEFLMQTRDDFIITQTSNGISFYKKQRLSDDMRRGKKAKTLFYKPEYSSGNGTGLIKELFDGRVFDNPKPLALIKDLLSIGSISPSGEDDGDDYIGEMEESPIILDFFSGSATTAHAVMQLNAEDGIKRKYIMVQLPEETDKASEASKAGFANICELGKERIRRAAKKVAQDNPGAEFDAGFRVFKLDESNMNEVYYSPAEYSQNLIAMLESNVKSDRSDLDLLFGCLLEWGLPLSLPYKSEKIEGCTVHNYNDGDLIACFDENIPDSVIKAIAKQQPLRAVFRDSSFAGSPSKINVGEIFKLMAPDTTVKVI